ncbi:MAG: hypothetical protein NVS3B25_04740 [Hymenobacter sp.]
MGQVLPGSARTTQAIRRSIQRSQESVQALANRYSLNPKTTAKWRKRATTAAAPMGPKPNSAFLSAEEEANAGAFGLHTRLPQDHRHYTLQETFPHRSRSARPAIHTTMA